MSNLHNRLQRLEQSIEAQTESENFLERRKKILDSPRFKTLQALVNELKPEKKGELCRQMQSHSPLEVLKVQLHSID